MDTVARKIPARAWGVVLVIYLASFTAPANMAKATSLAPVLIDFFNIQTDWLGYILGMFNICGILLAFPAVAFVKKLGFRAT